MLKNRSIKKKQRKKWSA